MSLNKNYLKKKNINFFLLNLMLCFEVKDSEYNGFSSAYQNPPESYLVVHQSANPKHNKGALY